MKETLPESSSYTDRFRSWVRTKAHGGQHSSSRRPNSNVLPISEPKGSSSNNNAVLSTASGGGGDTLVQSAAGTEDGGNQPPTAIRQDSKPGPVVESGGQAKHIIEPSLKPSLAKRFWANIIKIMFHTKLNVLLVFVPIGIAVREVPGLSPAIVFAFNAIAIIPLAGLLSHATESVARKMGDTIGALLNVTFGNIVELIIFMYVATWRTDQDKNDVWPIALIKGKIRIVQASLLGSILANLLLILGSAFFLGGMRYREQRYNSVATQTSTCLLSLSVISLVLPTAFHASFSDLLLADKQSLKISRGTSVVLLLVYVMYVVFQLKSHAYMYESTPQHIIDEEATPGPAAGWLDSDSSASSSSDSSDSDDSGRSRETLSRRVRRAMRAARRRKSSVVSAEEAALPVQNSSIGTADASLTWSDVSSTGAAGLAHRIHSKDGTEEEFEGEKPRRHGRKYRRSCKKHRKSKRKQAVEQETILENAEVQTKALADGGEPRRLDFAVTGVPAQHDGPFEGAPARSPFTALRGMSLALNVFAPPPHSTAPAPPVGPVSRARYGYGIRRTSSLPNMHGGSCTGAMVPSQLPLIRPPMALTAAEHDMHEEDLSRTAAIILLLCTTGVVALCAEYMVDSINGLVQTSGVKEIFIGLIVLPIVGNAAEHVTAITMAMKNKMDLAISVAVGSSIQIALFVTPLMVIIGWAMNQDMTLYFTLFETVALFVSTFIVNFLVLDGRSNYLEGALLCATYIIIATVAFFYPNMDEASSWGAPQTVSLGEILM